MVIVEFFGDRANQGRTRQRLLHAAPHDPVEVVLDPLIVNRDAP